MKNNIKNKFSDFRFEKGLLYIVIFLMLFSSGTLLAQNLEQGVKYLKLGNTYMTYQNFDKAKKFLDLGHSLVKGRSKYWEAVSYEYLGYYYMNSGKDKTKALEFLNKAYLIYQDIVKKPPDGSQAALEAIINEIRRKGNISSGNSLNNYEGSAVMNYDNQKLKTLPNDIPVNITNLSLADNKFKDFPTGLLSFNGLEFLNLENNKLKEIPEDISKLQNLVYLNLSGNKLKNLPAGLCNMKNLRMLDLKNNKIEIEDITNLIRCLPNTNVLYDQYIRKDEGVDEFGIEGEPGEGF